MNRFAELLDRLSYEPGRNNKLRLIVGYFREVEDPDRGYALAALTGALSFKHAKPGLIRDLIAERTDPVLFGLSYDYVGDLSETVALIWPAHSLSTVIPGAAQHEAQRSGALQTRDPGSPVSPSFTHAGVPGSRIGSLSRAVRDDNRNASQGSYGSALRS